MSKKKALITGVYGQDGIFLSKLLVSKGYSVTGTHSENSQSRQHNHRHIPEGVKLIVVNPEKSGELEKVLKSEEPDEVYNLSALSSVRISFEDPVLTRTLNETNPISTFNFIKENMPQVRVYQAGSSEMFGLPMENPQNENTELNPQSPYAISKAKVFEHVVQLRKSGLFAVNGIMYNHESEYRNENFVSRKISKNIARILLGKQDHFTLGDLSIVRDWGYAKDYVEAMWLMLQHDSPRDYVIATGESRSLYDYVQEALSIAGLSGSVSDWIVSDPKLYRAKEITNLTGDFSRANNELGWKPTTNFRTWVKNMIENDYELESCDASKN